MIAEETTLEKQFELLAWDCLGAAHLLPLRAPSLAASETIEVKD